MSKSQLPASSAEQDAAPDLTGDLALFRALKPYIGHCLTLNHDLNNALAGVIGYCEFLLMESDKFPPQQKHQLEMIAKCANQIKALVENLCDEKIALAEKIDLRPVTDAYKVIAKKLD